QNRGCGVVAALEVRRQAWGLAPKVPGNDTSDHFRLSVNALPHREVLPDADVWDFRERLADLTAPLVCPPVLVDRVAHDDRSCSSANVADASQVVAVEVVVAVD